MSLPTISPLRGLVEVTRLLRAREDLPALLEAVVRTIGESLGYRTVAVNLYRPQWDDFEVTTVYGNEEAKAVLLGQARPGDDWTVLLAEHFEHRGAYVVPSGAVDWDSLGPSYVPEGGRACHPDAWDPEDALFVPMRDQRGLLLGIISVDEPVSGRRPADDDLEVLVSLVDHATLAVEAMREAAESERHQRALEELLAVSSRITGETSNSEILGQVCTGISEALDFRNVCGALVDPETGTLVPQATAGWRLEELRRRGYRNAVCTNKLQQATMAVLAGLDLAGLFDGIAGGDRYPTRKPDPGHLLGLIGDVGGSAGRAVMIGDSENDAAVAHAARVPLVMMRYGYSRVDPATLGAAAVLDHFAELPATLERLGLIP